MNNFFWMVLLSLPSGGQESVVIVDHEPSADEIAGFCGRGVTCDGVIAAERLAGLELHLLPMDRNLKAS